MSMLWRPLHHLLHRFLNAVFRNVKEERIASRPGPSAAKKERSSDTKKGGKTKTKKGSLIRHIAL